jgi:hypothetical protein
MTQSYNLPARNSPLQAQQSYRFEFVRPRLEGQRRLIKDGGTLKTSSGLLLI